MALLALMPLASPVITPVALLVTVTTLVLLAAKSMPSPPPKVVRPVIKPEFTTVPVPTPWMPIEPWIVAPKLLVTERPVSRALMPAASKTKLGMSSLPIVPELFTVRLVPLALMPQTSPMPPLPRVVTVPKLLMVLLLPTSMPMLVPVTELGGDATTLIVSPFCKPLP